MKNQAHPSNSAAPPALSDPAGDALVAARRLERTARELQEAFARGAPGAVARRAIDLARQDLTVLLLLSEDLPDLPGQASPSLAPYAEAPR